MLDDTHLKKIRFFDLSPTESIPSLNAPAFSPKERESNSTNRESTVHRGEKDP
jgi:hypothetical protein